MISRSTVPDPEDASTWQALGDRLIARGDRAGGDAAHCNGVTASARDPVLIEAALALGEDKLAPAERILRDRLKTRPTDVAAMRMLAELAARLGRNGDAEKLLRRALELAPSFHEARFNLATILHRQTQSEQALAEVGRLLANEPSHPSYRNLHAAILARLGDFDRAIVVYAQLVLDFPRQPKGWMSYGHALKTVGRQADAVDAYRHAIEQAPTLGEAWWSLANLKTVSFDATDVAALNAALAIVDLDRTDRLHLEFAAGKALADAGDAATSFAHYAEANRLRAVQLRYEPDDTTTTVTRAKALFTPEFFAARAGWGHPAVDPIFIVGMPRSGSTLVEQILASHSAVEGTMELPDLPALAWRVGKRDGAAKDSLYPEALAALSADELYALGKEYLDRTRAQRRTDRPHFIDKLPNNWLHVGMIRLILPNATIIDARRHPMACCFSNFTQHFARGQGFSYSLDGMGRYYRDYTLLMETIDAAQPGVVHRVLHEDMVADTEGTVRALLKATRLDFEPACLRFWETDRPVRTASSEQVRQPITRHGVDRWQAFDPWLGPLRQALGDVLETWQGTPPTAAFR